MSIQVGSAEILFRNEWRRRRSDIWNTPLSTIINTNDKKQVIIESDYNVGQRRTGKYLAREQVVPAGSIRTGQVVEVLGYNYETWYTLT